MTPLQVRNAIIAYLATNWANTTSVAWPNKDFSHNVNQSWIRPTVLFGDSFEGEKGDDGIGFRTGVLIIQIFSPVNGGNTPALALAGTLEGLFRRKDIGGVIFDEPSTNEIGSNIKSTSEIDTINDIFYQVNMSIRFHTFIGE